MDASSAKISHLIKISNIKFTQKLLMIGYIFLILLSLYGMSWAPLTLVFSFGQWILIAISFVLVIFNISVLFQVFFLIRQRKYAAWFRLKVVGVSALVVGLIGLSMDIVTILGEPRGIENITNLVSLSLFSVITVIAYVLVWLCIGHGMKNRMIIDGQPITLTAEEIRAIRLRDRRLGYIFFGFAFISFIMIGVVVKLLNIPAEDVSQYKVLTTKIAFMPILLFILSLFYILRRRNFS